MPGNLETIREWPTVLGEGAVGVRGEGRAGEAGVSFVYFFTRPSYTDSERRLNVD